MGQNGERAPAETVDLLVVGGGIMGLWTALKGVEAGLSTLLIDRARIGAGASGGLLGALMPHTPDRWNAKKQFQFDALVSLEAEIAAIENVTGLSALYRRSGRLVPLARPDLRRVALSQAADAERNWQAGERDFAWQVMDAPPPALFAEQAVAEGVVLDTLSGRVSPRALLAVLQAALRRQPGAQIVEGIGLDRLDPAGGHASLSDGRRLAFAHCVLAAGSESFSLLDTLAPRARPSGKPVKGQAALLDTRLDPALPVIFSSGLYVVVHENGRAAIGSTSEEEFDAPFSTDAGLESLIDRAAALLPVLQGAAVVERWAGLRPKAVGRDPMVGPHPDFPRLQLMTGGFKISFGIAHRLAAAVIGGITGAGGPSLPPSFLCSSHLQDD
ncbi:NAD(P)/FAD-dependent oxidoreductase [Rhizobium sp. YIM 134829]|uniref:NAD(P)/FAD-dependent oxidoreductase n=1 Tax=Rhizobium sp. YIM 134829 TaxID=3390453 RepID=UPI00397DBCF3